MITIYSADAEGRLFTDPKQHFYIDAEILQERATYIRTKAVLNQIANRLGYKSFDSLDTAMRCAGVTADVLESWIISGTIAENMKRI